MKLLERFKLFFNGKAEELMPVDRTVELEEVLKKYKKALYETENKYYKSKGREDFYKKEVENNQNILNQCIKNAKNAKENNEQTKLKKLFDLKNATEEKLKLNEECLVQQEKITIKLNSFVNKLDKKKTEIERSLELLKTKNDFVESMEEFKAIGIEEDLNIDDIIKDIEIDFTSSSYELNDMNEDDSLLDESNIGFEDFVKEL